MKICRVCNFEGEDSLFTKNENKCKECNKQYQKQYREKNKEKLKIRKKVYYQNNRANIILQKKEFYQNNRQEALEAAAAHYIENKNIILLQQKDYRNKNREQIRQYQRNYRRNKISMDPLFKLRVNCSRLIHHALKDQKKNLSILQFLPYTMEELKKHLETQFDDKMSWTNYGSYWHIDHIIPQSKLRYSSMKDDNFQRCWALSNLRPLEAIQNMKKGAR